MYFKRVEINERVENLNCDIQEVINNHNEIKHYAYILHDKDNTLPHYHIYLDFGNLGVNTKNVAEWFGINEYSINRICSDTKVTVILLYFIHEKRTDLYQYSLTNIISNLSL